MAAQVGLGGYSLAVVRGQAHRHLLGPGLPLILLSVEAQIEAIFDDGEALVSELELRVLDGDERLLLLWPPQLLVHLARQREALLELLLLKLIIETVHY